MDLQHEHSHWPLTGHGRGHALGCEPTKWTRIWIKGVWILQPGHGHAAWIQSCSMDMNGALTSRPPTNRPSDIPTHTIRPQNILSTVTRQDAAYPSFLVQFCFNNLRGEGGLWSFKWTVPRKFLAHYWSVFLFLVRKWMGEIKEERERRDKRGI